MKMSRFFLLICFMTSLIVAAQEKKYPFNLKGTLVSSKGETPVPNAKVFLVQSGQKLDSVLTDSLGHYYFNERSVPGTAVFSITYTDEHGNYNGRGPDLRMTNEAVDFDINITMSGQRHQKWDNTARFDPGDSETIHNFEVELLKDLLAEHPGICVEFNLIQLESESQKLAAERLKTFRKLLEANGINEKQYTIKEKVRTREPGIDSYTGKAFTPGIEGKILSLEGECLSK